MKIQLFFLYFCFISVNISQNIQKAEYTTIMKIGGRENESIEYIFKAPMFVQVDDNDNIYIVDKIDSSIRIYNNEGKFIKRIGRRGRGPGEFLDISLFEIIDNKLYVFDMMNSRYIIFDLSGNIINSTKFDYGTFLWPKGIFEVKTGYVVYQDLSVIPGLFHQFNDKLNERIMSFGNDAYSNDPVSKIMILRSVEPLKITNVKFLYVPAFYSGKIYEYNYDGNIWKRGDIIKGYTYESEPFELLENEPKNKNQYSLRGYSFGSKVILKLKNESRGLFKLNDGRIIHFTLIKIKNYRVFGFELYAPNMNLLGYYELKRKEIKNSEAVDIPIYIKAKDKHDNFYLIDYSELPTIVKINIKLGKND